MDSKSSNKKIFFIAFLILAAGAFFLANQVRAQEETIAKGELLAEEASEFAQKVLQDHFEADILTRYPNAEVSWNSVAAINPDGGAWLVTAIVKPQNELPKPFFFEVKVSNVVSNPELTKKYLPKIAESQGL